MISIRQDVAELLRPPRRIRVSECARESIRIETPGGYAGPWDPELTPYMVEPMDMLKSRHHDAVVFVSPARAGKTQAMLDSWLAHAVIADPGDMGLYFSTQTLAYDFRKRRLERLHRHSPAIRAKLSPRAHDTTIEMVTYRHGMILNLGWPTSSQLAQRDLRYVAMSDYDSFPDDIAGEGSPFNLARKRVQVAMSAGMCLVESSPKREIISRRWTPDGPHMAPPVKGGVLALYNQGNRNRWYWQCLNGCHAWWEAPALPAYDDLPEITAAAATAHVACPHCGQVYRPGDKPKLNLGGRWLAEGEHLTPAGERQGDARQSTIASYWLLGCAAAMQSWGSIVTRYLQAKKEAETGDESALKATLNTDQGMPYLPLILSRAGGIEALDSRLEAAERYLIPVGVRTLLAAVDVQSNRFEVAVIGYGQAGERWIIDRFSLHRDTAGLDIQPPIYLEAWDLLVDRVVNATYRLPDGRELRVYRTAVDSGGYQSSRVRADSTRRAYDWWRSLIPRGLHHRVRLIKGGSTANAPAVKESYPDASQGGSKRATARGDVPMLILNTQRLKDALANDLAREVPGSGYVHLPDWLSDKHLAELSAEQRTEKGWQQIPGRRNETWDLMVYTAGLWSWLRGDKVKWDRSPPWAAEWESNSEVITRAQRELLKAAYPLPRAKSPRAKSPRGHGLAPDGWSL